jgi:hypothetical protein
MTHNARIALFINEPKSLLPQDFDDGNNAFKRITKLELGLDRRSERMIDAPIRFIFCIED